MPTPNRDELTAALLAAVRDVIDSRQIRMSDPDNPKFTVDSKKMVALNVSLMAFESAHPQFIPEPDYD
jgi:hypothetical protein